MLVSLKNYWDRNAVERLLAECMMADDERVREEVDSYLAEDSRELQGTFISGELAGLIGTRQGPGTDAEILHIAVQARWRGRGIGSAMIEEIRKCDGIGALRAETDREAVGFYSQCGFKISSLGEKYPGVERFSCIDT
ncbi:GNAT family N-acetyltransferase [Paenibacillus sp. sgz5001063]|uniref:GNAT family N-acetyltransferase n=1 Tax=Paenibacillus sp. sgz5001063 TaxID=3242474 RepID=UPI0036D24D04